MKDVNYFYLDDKTRLCEVIGESRVEYNIEEKVSDDEWIIVGDGTITKLFRKKISNE